MAAAEERMRRAVELGAEHLRAAWERASQFIVLLRAQRRLWVTAVAAGLVFLALVIAGAYWTLRPTPPPPIAIGAEAPWRYLLVCDQCGHRARMLEHPMRTLPEQNGLLKCPQCREFKATWYRRGGQALPPGGWSLTNEAAPDTDATGGSP